MTCHVDENNRSQVYPDCCLDKNNRVSDCDFAIGLKSEGKPREHCEHWHGEKPVVSVVQEPFKKEAS